jgi:hypothetical protein
MNVDTSQLEIFAKILAKESNIPSAEKLWRKRYDLTKLSELHIRKEAEKVGAIMKRRLDVIRAAVSDVRRAPSTRALASLRSAGQIYQVLLVSVGEEGTRLHAAAALVKENLEANKETWARFVADHKAYVFQSTKSSRFEFLAHVMPFVAEKLTPSAAAALLCTCTSFQADESIQKRIPRFHIRQIPGKFPHMTGLVDKKDEHFVINTNNIHLYVDLGVWSLRAHSLRDDPALDDGFEMSDDHASNFIPDFDVSIADRRRMSLEKKEKRWRECDGPAAPRNRHNRFSRISPDVFFDNISMNVSLVNSHTLRGVQKRRPGFMAVVRGETRLRRPYTASWMGLTNFPFCARPTVTELSSDHGDARFRCCITIDATSRKTGFPVLFKVYSEPFFVVSKPGVVKNLIKHTALAA